MKTLLVSACMLLIVFSCYIIHLKQEQNSLKLELIAADDYIGDLTHDLTYLYDNHVDATQVSLDSLHLNPVDFMSPIQITSNELYEVTGDNEDKRR